MPKRKETPAHLPTRAERIAARMVSFQQAYQTLVEVTKPGSRIERRDAIQKFEDALLTLPQVDQPLKHHFVNKMYWREIFNPKGCIITTKIHGEPNISVILQGRLLCITEDSVSILQAPMMFETKPGTKRVLYAEEDTIFCTIHPNPEDLRDIEALEARIIAPTFEVLEVSQ